MDLYMSENSETEDAVTIFNVKDIPSLLVLDEILNEDSQVNMTSLSALLLLNETKAKADYDSDGVSRHRLSLAYERLHSMPKILLEELSSHIRILDISNNEFENLGFLSQFKQLTTLICDHNMITSSTEIPYMPKLELLWMNHCQIKELYPWANKLRLCCPNLKYLSLMGNSAAPSYLNGGNFYDYLQYRLFMISLFPRLLHLDDRTVTKSQVKEAQRLYKRPFLEKISTMSSNTFPICVRTVTSKVSSLFAVTPIFANIKQRNTIV